MVTAFQVHLMVEEHRIDITEGGRSKVAYLKSKIKWRFSNYWTWTTIIHESLKLMFQRLYCYFYSNKERSASWKSSVVLMTNRHEKKIFKPLSLHTAERLQILESYFHSFCNVSSLRNIIHLLCRKTNICISWEERNKCEWFSWHHTLSNAINGLGCCKI